MPLKSSLIDQFNQIVGTENVLTGTTELVAYSYDTSRYRSMPDIVLYPTTTAHVAAITRICHQEQIPLYARGKGSATTGASVPTRGGVVLSLERMNKIIKLDVANRVMQVEPGLTNEEVQIAASKQGFFWAPDPASSSICTIGGNLGCNAAGPRAVKYGTCRENVLGLTAVIGTGEIIKTGVYTTKGVVGFDLTRLIIGSEGCLAIITQANLKLLPLPEAKTTLRAIYSDFRACTQAIIKIMEQPIIPCALEFLDVTAIDLIRDQVSIPENAQALLIIEVDGMQRELTSVAEKIAKVATNNGLIEIKTAASAEEAQTLWKARKALSPALKKIAPKKINEDVVVPISALPEYITYTHQLTHEYSVKIINFGHAGNGNIHTNIMLDPNDPKQEQDSQICLEKIFTKVLSLNGTLSGEHGVGIDKRDYIMKEIDPISIRLMHEIKNVFDPKGILNPGKVLPESR